MSPQNRPAALVVLVVEDEWLVRESVVGVLEDAGCVVLQADQGTDALAFLNGDTPIDVLFTDIRLIGSMNGWDVGEAFRAARPDLPVIYASGDSIQPDRQVPSSLFFDKPYEPAAILDACRRLSQGMGRSEALV